MEFISHVEELNSNLWKYHAVVPYKISKALLNGSKDRRVICTINGEHTFQCALMPKGDGSYFIMLNKSIRQKLQLNTGSKVTMTLTKDDSEFGMEIPEEMSASLESDPEAEGIFKSLTPGKQRALIYMVNSVKNSQKKIKKSLVILTHLKNNDGKIDYKQLNMEFRNANQF
jgi:hypothetical protein